MSGSKGLVSALQELNNIVGWASVDTKRICSNDRQSGPAQQSRNHFTYSLEQKKAREKANTLGSNRISKFSEGYVHSVEYQAIPSGHSNSTLFPNLNRQLKERTEFKTVPQTKLELVVNYCNTGKQADEYRELAIKRVMELLREINLPTTGGELLSFEDFVSKITTSAKEVYRLTKEAVDCHPLSNPHTIQCIDLRILVRELEKLIHAVKDGFAVRKRDTDSKEAINLLKKIAAGTAMLLVAMKNSKQLRDLQNQMRFMEKNLAGVVLCVNRFVPGQQHRSATEIKPASVTLPKDIPHLNDPKPPRVLAQEEKSKSPAPLRRREAFDEKELAERWARHIKQQEERQSPGSSPIDRVTQSIDDDTMKKEILQENPPEEVLQSQPPQQRSEFVESQVLENIFLIKEIESVVDVIDNPVILHNIDSAQLTDEVIETVEVFVSCIENLDCHRYRMWIETLGKLIQFVHTIDGLFNDRSNPKRIKLVEGSKQFARSNITLAATLCEVHHNQSHFLVYQQKAAVTESLEEVLEVMQEALEVATKITCDRCNQDIVGVYKIVKDHFKFCNSCFVCKTCRIPLKSYYELEGEYYCEKDYREKAWQQVAYCEKCREPVPASQLSAKSEEGPRLCDSCTLVFEEMSSLGGQ